MKRKMLEKCLKIAKEYLHKHLEAYRHFTFVVQSNKITEWGTNRRGEALTFLGYDKHTKLHSEIDAYFKAKGIMESGTFEVVNIRITKSGIIRNSRPCRRCFDFLKKMGCKRIWFTTDLENFARMEIEKE